MNSRRYSIRNDGRSSFILIQARINSVRSTSRVNQRQKNVRKAVSTLQLDRMARTRRMVKHLGNERVNSNSRSRRGRWTDECCSKRWKRRIILFRIRRGIGGIRIFINDKTLGIIIRSSELLYVCPPLYPDGKEPDVALGML